MKRQPNSTEVLDWEELEQAPNPRGAFSFLRPQSPVINTQEHRQQELTPAAGTGSKHKTSKVDVTPVVDTLLVPQDFPTVRDHTRFIAAIRFRMGTLRERISSTRLFGVLA